MAQIVTGPVIGQVTESTARILLEVDRDCELCCHLDLRHPDTNKQHTARDQEYQCRQTFRASRPSLFTFEGLAPFTEYQVRIEGVENHVLSTFRTICMSPDYEMNIAVVSCNKISVVHTIEPELDLWVELERRVTGGEVDMLLHLGDQIYADDAMHDVEGGKIKLKDVDCKFLQAKALLEGTPREDWAAEEAKICELYRDAYRETWSHPPTRSVLANVPNVMIMDDHEIRDDWGDSEGDRDTDTMDFFIARCGFLVFCEYQGQLYHDCLSGSEGSFMKAKHHRIFQLGSHTTVCLVDMRAARTFNHQPGDQSVVLGSSQWHDINMALDDTGPFGKNDTLIFGLGMPLVFYTTGLNDFLGENVKSADDMLGHWSSRAHVQEQKQVLDVLDSWKSRDLNREIILIGGDVHVGGFTTLWSEPGAAAEASMCGPQRTDSGYKKLALQMFSSSIGNAEFNAFTLLGIRLLGGEALNIFSSREVIHDRFAFQHHHWTADRNFGLVKVSSEPLKEEHSRCQCLLVKSSSSEGRIQEGKPYDLTYEKLPACTCVLS